MTTEERVLDAIRSENLLYDGEPVLVGFSGGMDSVALLTILDRLGYPVTAVHVHHGIRGKEADRDAAFTEAFCRDRQIPYLLKRIDVPAYASERHLSLETAARDLRYRIFEDLCAERNAKIAVAHHQSDQAETVLAHLIRGSGLNGLTGMRPLAGSVIRPLLKIEKAEIERYVRENGLPYVTDSTNLTPDCTRNALRLNVMPRLEEIHPGAENAIAACADRLNNLQKWLNKELDARFAALTEQTEDGLLLKYEPEDFLRSELIRRAVNGIRGNIIDLNEEKVSAISRLYDSQSGKEKVFFGSLHIQKTYDGLLFYQKDADFSAETPFVLGETVPWIDGVVRSEIVPAFSRGPESECVDATLLPPDAVLRTRRPGDYLTPLGMTGRVSLKEYLIDKKIPQKRRDHLVLLASGQEIYGILGVTVSEKCRVTDQTQQIIRIIKEKTT